MGGKVYQRERYVKDSGQAGGLLRFRVKPEGRMKQTLPFAGLEQDLPRLGGSGEKQADNCIWTDGCYKQLLALTVTGDALSNRCQGAFAGRDADGNTIIYAGDSTKLYQRNGTAWTDKSNGTYNTQFTQYWKFRQFNSLVIATNFADNVQSIEIGDGGNFADLDSAAPKARHAGVIGQFLFLGNTSDPTFGIVPHRVHWSAIGDPTDWPVLGTAAAAEAQSDAENLNPTYGQVMGIADGEKYGLVFQEAAITRFTYVGGAEIFDVDTYETSRGLIGPFALAQIGNVVIYLSKSGFHKTDGTNVTPIGIGRVDDVVLTALGTTYDTDRIYTAIDFLNKLVYFLYPTSVGSDPTTLAIYNFVEDKWTTGSQTAELIFSSKSLGYTLDQLDALFASIDDVTPSLDSSVWQGGQSQVGGFDAAHKLGDFSGSAKTATIDTAESALNHGGKALVRSIRPLVEGGTSTVALLTRNLQSSSQSAGSAVSLNSRTGSANFRTRARYHAARISIAGGFTRAFGADVEFYPCGET